jgi:hypothetical protein
MARSLKVKVQVHTRLYPNASKVASQTTDWKRHMNTTMNSLTSTAKALAYNSAVRRMMRWQWRDDSQGRVGAVLGSASSFAHWEEFGMINWKGPTGPIRRAVRGRGLRVREIGPNS